MTASRRNKLGKMGLPKEGSPRARGRRTNAHAPVRILKRRDGGGTAPRRAAVARCGRGACQGERARDIKASVKATLVPQIVATAEVACLKQKKGLRWAGRAPILQRERPHRPSRCPKNLSATVASWPELSVFAVLVSLHGQVPLVWAPRARLSSPTSPAPPHQYPS